MLEKGLLSVASENRGLLGLYTRLLRNLRFASTTEYRDNWPQFMVFSIVRMGEGNIAD